MKVSDYPAIILAGGLGTRLRPVINDLPKPMAPVNGKPFLHYVFQYLAKLRISKAVLSVGYKHETIQEFFGDKYLGIEIQYSIEQEPIGTGGGIKKAFQFTDNFSFVLNGDTFFDIDLTVLSDFYSQSKSDISLCLKPLHNFDRYGTVQIDDSNRITEFTEKKFMTEGLINGGVYFFHKDLFKSVSVGEKFSFETDVLQKHVRDMKFTGRVFDNYFIDIGVPEDYVKAQHDFR